MHFTRIRVLQSLILLVVSNIQSSGGHFFHRPGWRRRKFRLVFLPVNFSFSRARQYNSQNASNCLPTSKRNVEALPLGSVRLRRLEQRRLNVPLHPSAHGTISMQVNNINKTAENILHHPMREAEEIGKKKHKLATQLRTEKTLLPVELDWSCGKRKVAQHGPIPTTSAEKPTQHEPCSVYERKNRKKYEQKEELRKNENKLQTKKSYQRKMDADCLGFELVMLSFGRMSLLPATQTGFRVRPHRGVGMRQCLL